MFNADSSGKKRRDRSLLSLSPSEADDARGPLDLPNKSRIPRKVKTAAPSLLSFSSKAEPVAEPPPGRLERSIIDDLPRRERRLLGEQYRERFFDTPDMASDDEGRQEQTLHEDVTPSRERETQSAPMRTAQRRTGETGHERRFTADQQWRPLIDPTKVVSGILRAKWLIVATTLLGALLGVMIALATPKVYYAATELLFDPRDLQLIERDLTRGGLPSDATLALIENQVRIIMSGTVLNKVVDKLDLGNDREFNGRGGGGLGLVSGLRKLLSGGGGNSNANAEARMGRAIAVGNLAESLEVSRNANTFVIVIGATTQDPEKSALIATTMAEVFLETAGEMQSATAGRANNEITDRLDALRADVETAERAVADFKAKNDIVDAQGRLITDDEIVRLGEQLSAARGRTADLNAKAASARSLDVDGALGGALPEQVASPVMTELLSQYASLKQQAGRLSVRLGARHPDRLAVEAELTGARDEIARELRRITSSMQVELQRAVQLEQDLAASMARLKVAKGDLEGERVTLRELEREAAAKRSVYEALLLRARETNQQRGLNTANISIISPAYPPLLPTGASRSSIAISGMILGFLAGIALGGANGAFQSLRENMREGNENPRRQNGNGGGNSAPPPSGPTPSGPSGPPHGGGAGRIGRRADGQVNSGRDIATPPAPSAEPPRPAMFEPAVTETAPMPVPAMQQAFMPAAAPPIFVAQPQFSGPMAWPMQMPMQPYMHMPAMVPGANWPAPWPVQAMAYPTMSAAPAAAPQEAPVASPPDAQPVAPTPLDAIRARLGEFRRDVDELAQRRAARRRIG